MKLTCRIMISVIVCGFFARQSAIAYSRNPCRSTCLGVLLDSSGGICDYCVNNPPLAYRKCVEACNNAADPNVKQTAYDDVQKKITRNQMCDKACNNAFIPQFKSICNRCREYYK